MKSILVFLVALSLFGLSFSVHQAPDFKKRCTAIGIGKKASKDGSAITTHNNDCPDCDFRITSVPAKDWSEGSMRPIHRIRWLYPRYLEPSEEYSKVATPEEISSARKAAMSSLSALPEDCPFLSYGQKELVMDLTEQDDNLSLAYSLNAHNVHGPDYHREVLQEDTKTSSIFPQDFSSFSTHMSDDNEFTFSKPYAYIPQAPHTYSYVLGVYGLQNEKGLSISESTCGSIFAAKPIYQPNGTAIMHMETMIELALERCATARCAIQLIGMLGERYGFTSGEYDDPTDAASMREVLENSAEALMISDQDEVWVFHILPDDTGYSAIWAAQRVKDTDVAVIANQFIIGEIFEKDHENFIYSENLFSIAKKHNLWNEKEKRRLNFSLVYGVSFHESSYGCTRRVWRVFTLAAPSLLPFLSPYTDGLSKFGYNKNHRVKSKKTRVFRDNEDNEFYHANYFNFFKNSTEFLLSEHSRFLSYYYFDNLQNFLDPYPFSVTPDSPITLSEAMRFTKDQYEGTSFDLSRGLDAGPFGDTYRHGSLSVQESEGDVQGIEGAQFNEGLGFGRPISLWRTTYASVTQSRSWLSPSHSSSSFDAIDKISPNLSLPTSASVSSHPSTLSTPTSAKTVNPVVELLGPRVWIAQYAPHHSSFVPIYANALSIPSPLKHGSGYKFHAKSNWWLHCLTSNYISKLYRYTIGESKTFIRELERDSIASINDFERELSHNFNKYTPQELSEALSKHTESTSQHIWSEWFGFFFHMVGKYRDSISVTSPQEISFDKAITYMGYPRQYLEMIGFWGRPFTPPPGEQSPQRVEPINVITFETPQEYSSKAGRFFYAPYDIQGDSSPVSATTGSHIVLINIMLLLAGAFLGASAVHYYYVTKRDTFGYATIP